MILFAYLLGVATALPLAVMIMVFVKTRVIELGSPELAKLIPRIRTNKKKKTPTPYSDQRAWQSERGDP